MVTTVEALTVPVVTLKVALVARDGTVTFDGTCAAVRLLLERLTGIPPP
jgi:hypothetical protein